MLGIATDIGGRSRDLRARRRPRGVPEGEGRRPRGAARATLSVIEEMARRLLDEEGAAVSGCAGVSFAFCGIVDDDRGCVLATLDDKFQDAIA